MKRTVMISNRSLVGALDKGKVPKELRKCLYPTAKVYVSGGKKCYCGTKFLKRTQQRVSTSQGNLMRRSGAFPKIANL